MPTDSDKKGIPLSSTPSGPINVGATVTRQMIRYDPRTGKGTPVGPPATWEAKTHPITREEFMGSSQQTAPPARPPSYRKGGRVKRTGPAKLHKGERILTKRQNRRYKRSAGR